MYPSDGVSPVIFFGFIVMYPIFEMFGIERFRGGFFIFFCGFEERKVIFGGMEWADLERKWTGRWQGADDLGAGQAHRRLLRP